MNYSNMPIQGKAIIRNSNNSFFQNGVTASQDCSVCCAVGSSCPGCTCGIA